MERERIIHILEFLSRYTDDEKSATVKEIQTYLAAQTNVGSISPLSIRRDIDSLILAGNQIEIERGPHNTYYYRMPSRGFTFNEIRFLADSVSINKFLSAEQKQRLFRKFEGLCSQAEVRKLIGRITISEVTPPSLDLLENLERIYQILAEHQKINFAYGKYNTQKQMVYYDKKRELIPCRVVYFNERFYLKCVSEETGQVRTYRVDRMKNITAGEKAEVCLELPKREGAVVDIFEPERYENIRLRVSRELLDDMLEQLGNYASIRDDLSHPGYVIVRAKIGISYGFYRWIMKYGSTVEILSPESVRRDFAEKIRQVCHMYDDIPEESDSERESKNGQPRLPV